MAWTGLTGYDFIDPAEVTPARAAQIRAWRVDQDMSWRGVAAAATEAWGPGFGDNQLYGRDLCNAAARALGQDPDADPWN
jgi:hypothetical protein